MINKTQNHLLSQMQALESLAKGQAMQPEVKTEQNQSFGDLMQQAVGKVNETQMQASSLTKAFELGSFEALTQVRNKLLTAYQDVMNMSV
jgi:flagellar hook-basal body complex protein FliE